MKRNRGDIRLAAYERSLKMDRELDKHYDFKYKLKEEDIKRGYIKVDPYFVSYIYKFNQIEPTGGLFHIFKTVARFGRKNGIVREVRAIYASIKRVAEIYGIDLEEE